MKTSAARLFFLISLTLHQQMYPGSFSLLSWNILAHHVYEKYCCYDGKKNSRTTIDTLIKDNQLMPLEQRLLLFKKAFEKGNFAHGTDIVCLQEVDLKEGREGAAFLQFLKSKGYALIVPTTRGSQCTCITYDPEKFSFVTSSSWIMTKSTQKHHTHNTSTIISFKNIRNVPLLTIINCHIPWEPLDGVDYQLNAMKKQILPRCEDNSYTIVCGDFNYETYKNSGSRSIKSYERLTKEVFPSSDWSDVSLEHGHSQTPTNYFNVFQKVDYIFYTPHTQFKDMPRLTCESALQEPRDTTQLIKFMQPEKDEGPMISNFPSDHTMLRAIFTLKK